MTTLNINTNLASEYHVLSMLYRLGFNAFLTLGNKKSVDIIIDHDGETITVDVKGLQGTTNFPIDNWTKIDNKHFLIFVSFLNEIQNTALVPEVYVVPSTRINEKFPELNGASMVYENPKKNRKVVQLSRLRKLKGEFLNKWELLNA